MSVMNCFQVDEKRGGEMLRNYVTIIFPTPSKETNQIIGYITSYSSMLAERDLTLPRFLLTDVIEEHVFNETYMVLW